MLNRLGLTPNQIKVYLALSCLSISTAKTIAKNSGVARSDVYRIVAMLETLGLVERTISVPCKFMAISISDAFSILMECRMRETAELQAEARDIIEKFKNNNKQIAPEETENRFFLVPEQVTLLKKKRSLKEVQRSLDVITSWTYPDAIMLIDMEDMIDALQRGIEIRCITGKTRKEEFELNIVEQLTNQLNFKIRWLLDPPTALMSIYDKEEAWIYTGINPKLKEFPTLNTNNPCLLSILQDYFEIMWITAMDYVPSQH